MKRRCGEQGHLWLFPAHEAPAEPDHSRRSANTQRQLLCLAVVWHNTGPTFVAVSLLDSCPCLVLGLFL